MQKKLMRMRQENIIGDTIIFLQHPPVLTMGTSCEEGGNENLLVSEDVLRDKGVQLYRTNRGGDVTYHGPGQIVGYPIISLLNHNKDIRKYIHNLEEVFIDLLREEFELEFGRDKVHRGVWIGSDKITAIGCSIKKWVTMHGFAFNVNTDMDYFKLINPCGILDKGVTSLEDLTGCRHDEDVMVGLVLEYFAEIFGYDRIIDYGEDIEKLTGGEEHGIKKTGVA